VTLAALQREIAARLEAAGIEEAAAEARFIMMEAARLDAAGLLAACRDPVSGEVRDRAEAMAARRTAREPLSHILGHQPFWTLDLRVTPDVLTPRADTETLVRAALGAAPSGPFRVLDIGTGSGAIVLALLSERPGATGVATDISPAALAVARANAQAHGLEGRAEFVQTSWADGVEGAFDLVVSNPPYIASAVIAGLDAEVRDHEPHLALDGGPDGLGPYPHLFREARRLLGPRGTGVFEIGFDQGEAALELARAAGAERAELRRDFGGRDRAVVFGFKSA
jgi:release factor glutamine methyltransferase